ncbi:MAG: neutral/alkaline non-lysosomal ceramidase N-terminal domain-containing protein [Ornithinimicrobium sp.]
MASFAKPSKPRREHIMDGCRVGLGRVDITPTSPGSTMGWGPMGRTDAMPPTNPDQRLVVTALALEDARGERVVLVNADLHCGGVHLWRAAVRASGLADSRVVLCGTHTHEGPGQRYGGLMYTLMAGPSPTTPWDSTRRLTGLVARAVRESIVNMKPGGTAVVRPVVRGVASNRAVPAWVHYAAETREEFLERWPAEAAAPLPDRLRDQRATTLVARSDDGTVEAALAWYAVHGTALGAEWMTFGSDLWGPARRAAEMDGATVGFGGGSSGDISPLPIDEAGQRRTSDDGRSSAQGSELATMVGQRLGAAVRQAVNSARAHVSGFSLSVAHEQWEPRRSGLPMPVSGLATVGGGVDGPTERWNDVADGIRAPGYQAMRDRAHPDADGQGPKVGILHAYTRLPIPVGWLFAAFAPKRLPLHVIRVGEHTFATVPGEATTMTGARIEDAVASASGAGRTSSVIGFAGDYGGYWASPEEYLEQRYEGSSTIFGAHAATRLTQRLEKLAARTD